MQSIGLDANDQLHKTVDVVLRIKIITTLFVVLRVLVSHEWLKTLQSCNKFVMVKSQKL